MQHNGVVLPPDNNPPPPPPPAHNCPVNGHWCEADGKCNCNDGYYWNGNACVLPSCPRHAHFNWQSLQCDCDNGYNWDGSQCAPSCLQNGHYDPGQDKCICNDGYHQDNGLCAKDVPPPPIGPLQFPPKKTVPVKRPSTFSPDPSNTPPPTKTTPSDPDPMSRTSSATSTSTCALTKRDDSSEIPWGCSCQGLIDANKRAELLAAYLTVTEIYAEDAIEATCVAVRALLVVLDSYDSKSRSKNQWNKKIEAVVSSVVAGRSLLDPSVIIQAQGFSKKLAGNNVPHNQNGLLCALRNDIEDADEFPTGRNKQGQCTEPHAYAKYLDLGGVRQAEFSVAVQISGKMDDYQIKTIPKCDTCKAYYFLGVIPIYLYLGTPDSPQQIDLITNGFWAAPTQTSSIVNASLL